ncbi:hypothetical protein ABIB48_000799 [Arthrobacter sp. UYCu511]
MVAVMTRTFATTSRALSDFDRLISARATLLALGVRLSTSALETDSLRSKIGANGAVIIPASASNLARRGAQSQLAGTLREIRWQASAICTENAPDNP